MLDLRSPKINAEDMGTHAVDSSRPLLTFGRVDLVRVQVGYRASPEDLAYQQFLLDLSVLEAVNARDRDAFDERLALVPWSRPCTRVPMRRGTTPFTSTGGTPAGVRVRVPWKSGSS